MRTKSFFFSILQFAAVEVMEVYWILTIAIFLVTFTTIPLGIDLLKVMFPHWRLSRMVGRTAHIFLFLTVTGLVALIIYYQYAVFLPLLLDHQNPLQSLSGLFHVLFSSWLWLNVLGNYYHTVSMHPGADASYFPWRVKFEEEKLASYGIDIKPAPTVSCSTANDDSRVRNDSGSPEHRHQKPTGADWKPSRSHFCSSCHCAVFYWDHHCPFAGNCIGLRNFSNFFLGLCYGVIGGCYASVITGPYFVRCNLLPLFDADVLPEQCVELGVDSYIFVVVLLGTWLASSMVGLYVLLLLSDLSTYDLLKYWDRYPMIQVVLQRISARKFLDADSRFRILLLNRQENFLWFLVPVRNSKLCV